MEFKPFRRSRTLHNNEHLRVRVALQPAPDEVAPDYAQWQVSGPVLTSEGDEIQARVEFDPATGIAVLDAAVGLERGKAQMDVLTDFGTGGSTWVRLGSVYVTVKSGSGAHG